MTDPAVLALVKKYRGRTLYMPQRLHEHHPLVMLLGQADAEALQAFIGSGNSRQIPMLAGYDRELRDRSIRAAVATGWSQSDVANRFHLSIRTVRRALKRAGQ